MKSLSHVWLFATPWTAAYQAPPSMRFSRQEYWSGLPFPSAMHESAKWKWRLSVVSDSLWPHGLQPTRPLHPWDFPGKSTGVDCHCLLRLCQLGENKCVSSSYGFLSFLPASLLVPWLPWVQQTLCPVRSSESGAISSSKWSFWPRDWPTSLVSPASPALAGGFFTHWDTWEAPNKGGRRH